MAAPEAGTGGRTAVRSEVRTEVKRPRLALGVTLQVQLLGSLCLSVPAVLAPAVAPALGYAVDRVGLFVGIAYLAAMSAGLLTGGWVARIGATAVSQLALLAFGIGMVAVTSGHPWLLVGAALVVGTGYGVINPAAASLLNHHSPIRRRGLYFSIKQAGVPMGVALAGLLMPWGLVTIGWRPSLAVFAAVCVVFSLMLLPVRKQLAPSPARTARQAPARPPALVRVLKDPGLRRLSAASFAFALSQLTFMTFLVAYLNLQLGLSLVLAAGVLAASQAVSVAARIGWGYAGDRWFDGGRLLGWLGVGSGAAFVALGCLAYLPEAAGSLTQAPDFEPMRDPMRVSLAIAAIAASMLCALTAMGWNGVFFAELARRTGPEDMAAVAGAAQFFTFFGSMSGPVVFGEIIRYGWSYSTGYLLLAVFPAMAGWWLMRGHPTRT